MADKSRFLYPNGRFDRAGWKRHVDYLRKRHSQKTYYEILRVWQTYLKRGEHRCSPYRTSNSEYVLDKVNGIVYLFSDHWGEVASCRWNVKPEQKAGYMIAMARLQDFRTINN